eukprot:748043-Hanusia_phi.AAC.1
MPGSPGRRVSHPPEAARRVLALSTFAVAPRRCHVHCQETVPAAIRSERPGPGRFKLVLLGSETVARYETTAKVTVDRIQSTALYRRGR